MLSSLPLSRGSVSRGLALAAMAAGLATGLADLSGAPLLITLGLAVAFAFALAILDPVHAWLWVVLESAGVLATQLADPSLSATLDQRTGAALVAALVVLLPAAIAALLGAVAGRAARW